MKYKYENVEKSIIDWVVTKKYKVNEKIPTESELMEMFNVSRDTIRKAINNLETKNYVYKKQGSGIYIADWTENRENLKSSKSVAVLTTYISNYIFPNIIRGMEDTLYSESYSLLMSSTNNNVMFENVNLKNLLAHKVDGLILEPTKSAFKNPNAEYLKSIVSKNIPVVTINASYPEIDVPSLLVDDFKGGKLATNHLISLGHRKLLGIFKVDDFQGINRMNGFVTECQQNNLEPSSGMILTFLSDEKTNSLPSQIEYILSSPNRPTGIFCYNDEIAYLVSTIARELNIKIPEELSIVGFDDSYLSVVMQPNLTSIKHPKELMGKDAANLIIKLINNNNHYDTSDSILYEPQLIVRKSTSLCE